MRADSLLFVCTGNTCRSPMAEALARMKAAETGRDRLQIRSAGTDAWNGAPASRLARQTAAARGHDLAAHRARALSGGEIERTDLVIVMTERHGQVVARAAPGARIALATDFLPAGHRLRGRGVPDPYGADLPAYEATWAVLDECVEGLFASLEPSRRPDAETT